MEIISEEIELGRGIEELIQPAVTANFSMENYMGKTNPGFYQAIFESFYPVLEEKLMKVRIASENGDILAQSIEYLKYQDCLNNAKKDNIMDYLGRCRNIAKEQNIDFDPFKLYEEIADELNDNDVILEIMNKMRSLEEQKNPNSELN